MPIDSPSSLGDFSVFYTGADTSEDFCPDSHPIAEENPTLNPIHEAPPAPPEEAVESARDPPAPAPAQEGNEPNPLKAPDVEDMMLERFIAMMQQLRDERQQGEPVPPAQPTESKRREQFPQTLFGMKTQPFYQAQQPRLDNDDYEQIFPEDAYGDECGPNARVFKVYHQEAAAYDNDMITQSADSSDVLLVFAGLFSAVLTTFVAQTSQALDTDNSAISNSLLSEIVELQRAQANGTSFNNVDRAITETTPSSSDVWVNGLWFTSLTLSLATALFAVLTKQWLRHYVTTTSGTVRDRCLIRQFRFMGMQKWHVVTIIGVLPILLHLSLGIFLSGLILFLIPRSLPLAYIVGGMASIVYSLYFITNLLPVIDIQCPYRTPFSEILNVLGYQFRVGYLFICASILRLLNVVITYLHKPYIHLRAHKFEVKEIPDFKHLREQEHNHVQQESTVAHMSFQAIKWLWRTSSSPSVRSVALQAIGGLPPSQRDAVKAISFPFWYDLHQFILKCFTDTTPKTIHPGYNAKLERLLRSEPISYTLTHYVHNIDMYALFYEKHNVEGMLAAYPLKLSSLTQYRPICPEPFDNFILSHLLTSDNIKAPPCVWLNLFQEHTRQRITISFHPEFYLSLCKRTLHSAGTCSWMRDTSHDTALMSIEEALLKRSPEFILTVFESHDPFRTSSSLSDSSSPPDSLHLHALFVLHNFLSDQSFPDPQTASLQASVMSNMEGCLIDDSGTLTDCVAVLNKCIALIDSSLFTLQDWTMSDDQCTYHKSILYCYYQAAKTFKERFGYHIPSNTWKGLKQITEIAFMKDDISVAAQGFWQSALNWDVPEAYIFFISTHALGHHDPEIDKSYSPFMYVVKSFVTGISRHQQAATSLGLHWSPPVFEPLLKCLEYLHEGNNLYSACHILVMYYSSETIPLLAGIQPDNPEWDICRQKLRDQMDNNPQYKVAVEALDEFFENHHLSISGRILRHLGIDHKRAKDPQRQDLESGQIQEIKPNTESVSVKGNIDDGGAGTEDTVPVDNRESGAGPELGSMVLRLVDIVD